MKKQIKKVVGMLVLIAVLFTSVGQEAQAAKQIKWPYGTYECNSKKAAKRVGGKNKICISWQYASDPGDSYAEIITFHRPGGYSDALSNGDSMLFRKVGTNKYKSKTTYYQSCSFRYEIKVYKKSLKIKEYTNYGGDGGLYLPGKKWYTFKLKKRMSKNVG